MELSEFYDELEKHDWTHAMSDDHRVWKRGFANMQRLQRIAKESEEHQKLYDAWASYQNFMGERGPKPERK